MAPVTECCCCFSLVNVSITTSCSLLSEHCFCYECVRTYVSVELGRGNTTFKCIAASVDCSGTILMTRDMLGLDLTTSIARVEAANTERRKRIEENETAKVIKSCKACGASIQKIEGCNRVVCICGSAICWVCNDSISPKDYDHFNTGPKYCNLFTYESDNIENHNIGEDIEQHQHHRRRHRHHRREQPIRTRTDDDLPLIDRITTDIDRLQTISDNLYIERAYNRGFRDRLIEIERNRTNNRVDDYSMKPSSTDKLIPLDQMPYPVYYNTVRSRVLRSIGIYRNQS